MSKAIEWDDSYLIGNPNLDEQHKKLFAIAGELENLEHGPDESIRVKEILNSLREYMIYHFEEEEAYMTEFRYPGLQEHKVLHQRFINDMRSIIKVPVRLNILKIRIHTFIQKWLVEHIVKEDMKYQAWAQKQTPLADEHIFDIDSK